MSDPTGTNLTAAEARRITRSGVLPRSLQLGERIRNLRTDVDTVLDYAEREQHASIRYATFPYTGSPVAQETVVIGSDTYQFMAAAGAVTNDTYVAVTRTGTADTDYANLVTAINGQTDLNQHATITLIDAVTPAKANGTSNVLAVLDSGNNTVYIYDADAPGGTQVEAGSSSVALSDTATNGGPWAPLNLNLSLASGAAVMTRAAHVRHTVVAGDLSATQPLLIPVPFDPVMYDIVVRDAQGAARDAYVEVLEPASVGGQSFVSVNLADTTPTNVKKQSITVPVMPAQATKRVELVIPVNPPKVKEITIPLADNDVSVQTWYPSATISISNITFSRGEAAGSTLVASLDKVTAATAADTVSLATSVNLAAGTSGAVQTFDPDEVGGDFPIAVTVNEALIFTVTAGNGTVAPRSVTFWVTYSESGAAASASWNPPVGSTITAYHFVRSEAAVGALTLNLDKITKTTGDTVAVLSTALTVAGGSENVETSFTPSAALPHALLSTQGLKATVVAGPGTTAKTVTLVIEYTETSAVSGKGVAHWFPGKACLVTGFTTTLGETHVGSTLTMNTDVITASNGAVATVLGTLVSVVGTKDLETAHTPDEAGWGAGPLALTALQGLRFETVADATTKAPVAVTVHVKYVETVIATDVLDVTILGA